MSSRVGRLHVRCTGPPEQSDRALRLRGRLVSTARTHLPEALGRSLEDGRSERRIFAERVRVELDFDPDDYDDVTTAALWAGRVLAALELERAAGGAGVEIFESDAEFYGRAAVEYARAGVLPWFFADLCCGAGSPSARAFLEAFDTPERVAALSRALAERRDAASALYARLSEPERRSATQALEGTGAWGDWAEDAPTARSGAPPREPAGTDPARRDRRTSPAAAPTPSPRTAASRGAAVTPQGDAASGEPAAEGPVTLERWHAALDRVARGGPVGLAGTAGAAATRASAPSPTDVPTAAPSTPDDGSARQAPLPATGGPTRRTDESTRDDAESSDVEDVESAWWTRAGGLVLLYPWVADLLADDVPVGAELAHRTWSLAAVISPEEETLRLADPLVRVLAGDDPALRPPNLPPPENLERLRKAAEGVVRSFAGCLPGFEESTSEYLRRFVLERVGLVAALPEGGYGVRLEPMPLDAILSRLPYPLGPFRFAWTEQIAVELRRA